MSPAESTPCAAARRSSLPSRSAEPAPRARPLYGAPGPLCGAPGPLCGAPGPPVRCARPPVRCAETRRSRLAALRRNEICMRGIPVQNKGGTASFASPLFGGGGAFLFVFARTRKAPPQSFFAHARSPLPRRKAPAHACRPVKQRIPPSRPHDAAERTIPAHTTHPYTSTHSNRHTQHIHTSTHTFCFEVKGHERDITATQAARAGRH